MTDGREEFHKLIASLRTGERYHRLLDDIEDTFNRKNAGYAGTDNPDPWANFRAAEDLGLPVSTGVLVRTSDKFARLKSLTRNAANERVGESREETALDGAVYLLIYICTLLEEKQLHDWLMNGLENRD